MNLGTWLFTKYEVDGDKNHLELALSHSKEAVGLVHSNQLGRGTYLEHLGGMLSQGYKKAGERGDLEKAIHLGVDAMAATPPKHPSLPHSQAALSIRLAKRYMIDGSTVDLQGGINQLKRAIEATSDNAHPDQGKYLDSYGKDATGDV